MDPYSQLPTELKLKVASYLSSANLAALARVNRAQSTIARSYLYEAPEISQPDEGYRVMSLLRTLSAQPRLFLKIRSLSLNIVYCVLPPGPGLFHDEVDDLTRGYWSMRKRKDENRFCPAYKKTKATLTKLLRKCNVTAELYPWWFEMLQRWYAACFYGGIAALSPNLEHLSIVWYHKRADGGYDLPHRDSGEIGHAVLGLEDKFASGWELPKVTSVNLESGRISWHNLCQNAGKFHNLKLSLYAGLRNSAVNELDHITHLQVCVNFDDPLGILWTQSSYQSCPYLAPLPNLKTVKLLLDYAPPRIPFEVAAHDWQDSLERKTLVEMRDGPLGVLILRLQSENSNLQETELLVKRRRPFHKEEYFWRARLSILLENLKASASTLETLELVPANPMVMAELRLLDAVPCLGAFIKLRKLTLPFRPCIDNLSETLPPCLEELDLYCYAPITTSFLDDIIAHKREHRIFCRLNMFCEQEKNVTTQNLDARFAEERIEVYVYLRGKGLVQAITAEGKTWSSQTWREAPQSNLVYEDTELVMPMS